MSFPPYLSSAMVRFPLRIGQKGFEGGPEKGNWAKVGSYEHHCTPQTIK